MSSMTACLPATRRVGKRMVSSNPDACVYAATRRFVPPRSTPTEKELIRSQISTSTEEFPHSALWTVTRSESGQYIDCAGRLKVEQQPSAIYTKITVVE